MWGDDVLINSIGGIISQLCVCVCVCKIIMVCILNILQFICQLYLNNAEKKKIQLYAIYILDQRYWIKVES